MTQDANIAHMLWRSAGRLPHKAAVIERDHTSTYEDMVHRASAVASALLDIGTQPGDRVVLLVERGADAVAAYFGTLAVGGVAIVVNELARPRQIEYVLKSSSAVALAASRTILARMHRDLETQARIIHVDDLTNADAIQPLPRAPSDLAQITYTSGSTGMPKGVVANHGNVWAAIEAVTGYLELGEDDRVAAILPFSGVYGANQMQCSCMIGGTLVVPRSPIMNQIAAELREREVTVLAAVPPLWMQLLHAPLFTREPIPSLRILQNAGGHLAPSAVSELHALQPQAKIFLQYGMTEVFRSTFLPPDEIDRRSGSMGRAMPGTEILVVRDDDTLCEPGEVGELVHSGPTVTVGYWNDPEGTARTYRPHPVTGGEPMVVYSGDMVRRDDEGYLHFVGRRDRLIKTLGYRVGPDEILDTLYASGEIVEGVVTAEEDSERGHRILAFVVLRENGSASRLSSFCKRELPRYMHPAVIEVLDEIPKSPNGKHDIRALSNANVT